MKVRLYIQSQEEKKLATHGSHENTMEKEKGKFLIVKVLPKIFQKMMIPLFILAFLLYKIHVVCYKMVVMSHFTHSVALTLSFRTSFLI